MGREYSSNRRSPRARSSAPHQFLVIMATFLLGYLTATVFDIETISRWLNAQVLAHQEINKAPTPSHAQQHAAIPPKPKFEFYTLLANEKVPNSQQATNSTTNPSAATATTSSPGTAQTAAVNTVAATMSGASAVKSNSNPLKVQKSAVTAAVDARHTASVRAAYSVQVASFKARQDAEHMKGSLILKGFNVTVVPISHVSRGNWFRVVVGPYANRTLANKAQMDLARNEHLRGMVTAG